MNCFAALCRKQALPYARIIKCFRKKLSAKFQLIVKKNGNKDRVYNLEANPDKGKPFIIKKADGTIVKAPSLKNARKDENKNQQAVTDREEKLARLDNMSTVLLQEKNKGKSSAYLRTYAEQAKREINNGSATKMDYWAIGLDINIALDPYKNRMMTDDEMKTLYKSMSNGQDKAWLYDQWKRRKILPSGIVRPSDSIPQGIIPGRW